MVLPSIPALEYDAAMKANESNLIDELKGVDVTDFQERIQKINIHELREELKNIDVRNAVEQLKEKIKDNPGQPQCIVTFMALILLLKLFVSIIGLIFAAVSTIVDVASIILNKIVALTFAILKPIIKLTILSLIAYFLIAAIIDLSFLCIFLMLILLTGGS